MRTKKMIILDYIKSYFYSALIITAILAISDQFYRAIFVFISSYIVLLIVLSPFLLLEIMEVKSETMRAKIKICLITGSASMTLFFFCLLTLIRIDA